MIPLLIPAVLGLGGLSYWAAKKHSLKGKMTPERQIIYETLLKSQKDPAVLAKFSSIFRNEGFPAEADLLAKRAKLRIMPPAQRAQRKQILQDALASTNPTAVKAVADAYHAEGATGAAAQLMQHAAGLQQLQGAGINLAQQGAAQAQGMAQNAAANAVSSLTSKAPPIVQAAAKMAEQAAAKAVTSAATDALSGLFANGEGGEHYRAKDVVSIDAVEAETIGDEVAGSDPNKNPQDDANGRVTEHLTTVLEMSPHLGD